MAQQDEKKPFERLPVDVVPINYKVELKPDLVAFTFQGKLEITAKVHIQMIIDDDYLMYVSMCLLNTMILLCVCVYRCVRRPM